MPWEFLISNNSFFSLIYIHSSFSLSFICKLVFWPTHLPRFHKETVRWTIKVLCWLRNSDNFVGQSFCFVSLDLKQKKYQQFMYPVSWFSYCVVLLFVLLNIVRTLCTLIHFFFISLCSSQICSQKDGPFQFPSVQVCTLGPSPHGRCHWRTHHVLQVSITFSGKLKVKINYELCDAKPHFILWFCCMTRPKGKGSSVFAISI